MLNQCQISGFADEIDRNCNNQIRVLQKLGQTFIELRAADGVGIADFSMEKAKEIKEKLDAAGIGVSALGSPCGKMAITEEFTEHMENFKKVVALAKFFDTKYIRMFSFYMPKVEKEEGHLEEISDDEIATYREEVHNRLRQMIEYATKEDMILLHENEKGIYGDNVRRCLDLMENFYGEHFKCTFDFANFVQCKQDTMEAYESLKPYIAYVHIKDALYETGEVVPAGMGDGNVKEILQKLEEIGYNGYLSLEPHLTNFNGFSDLEQDEQAESKKMSDGEKAYTVAYSALMELLK